MGRKAEGKRLPLKDPPDTEMGRLYICGKRWTVSLSPGHLFEDDGQLLHGITDQEEYSIRLSQRVVGSGMAAAALHEVKHAIDWSAGRGHDQDEENCARQTEAGLVSLISDPRNDWFLRWVQKELRK